MKYDIQCKRCNKISSRWKCEIEKIKDVSQYVCKSCKSKNCRETRNCPVCKKEFITTKWDNKTTCSYACSNKHFRTGENNGNWKPQVYRSTCFSKHKKECVVCKEHKIVEVHHYNQNHKDNRVENLIPLCPTHHQYMHSKYAQEIDYIVKEYYNNFISRHIC